MPYLSTILLADGEPRLTGAAVEQLRRTPEDVLVGAPLGELLLAAEFAVRVLEAAADPGRYSRLVIGHDSLTAEEIESDDAATREVSANAVAADCAMLVYARVSRALAIADERGTDPPPGVEDLPPNVFLSPETAAWLAGAVPTVRKLRLILGVASMAYAFSRLSKGLSLLNFDPTQRRATTVATVTEQVAFDLTGAITFSPTLLALLGERDVIHLRSLASVLDQRYLEELRELGRNSSPVFFDPSTALCTSAIEAIAVVWDYVSGQDGATVQKVRAALDLHKELLTRNAPPPGGRSYFDRSQLSDLVVRPRDPYRWPLGIPEVEGLVRECVLQIVHTGALERAIQAPPGGWMRIESPRGRSTVFLRVPSREHFIGAFSSHHAAYVEACATTFDRSPLLAWILLPSTGGTNGSPVAAFTRTACASIAATLEALVEDQQRIENLKSLAEAVGPATAGAAGGALLEAMLGADAVRLYGTGSVAGAAVGAWIQWILARRGAPAP